MTRVLVAGVGNIFLGDDGFGVEVARRLSIQDFPDWVKVADYGIRGMHLAYDLAGAGYELTILVDATTRGEAPGTVYVIELDPVDPGEHPPLLDAHGMQPDVVMGLVGVLGAEVGRVLLVGCEPASLDDGMRLSEPVAAAVGTAVTAVLDLINRLDAQEELTCASAFQEK